MSGHKPRFSTSLDDHLMNNHCYESLKCEQASLLNYILISTSIPQVTIGQSNNGINLHIKVG